MSKCLMTSLSEIAKHNPCDEGWRSLLDLKGVDYVPVDDFCGDSELFPVSDIGNLGNVEWLCWTSILFDGEDLKRYIRFYLYCTNSVRHLLKQEFLEKLCDILDGSIPSWFLYLSSKGYSVGGV